MESISFAIIFQASRITRSNNEFSAFQFFVRFREILRSNEKLFKPFHDERSENICNYIIHGTFFVQAIQLVQKLLHLVVVKRG